MVSATPGQRGDVIGRQIRGGVRSVAGLRITGAHPAMSGHVAGDKSLLVGPVLGVVVGPVYSTTHTVGGAS